MEKDILTVFNGSWYTRKQVEQKLLPKKMYSAKFIGSDGKEYWFKSKRGRVFFERRCDLTNSLNHAFGCDCCYEWIKKYGDQIIIETRYIR